MQLTERADVWRMVGTYEQGKTMEAVLTRVPCLRVPISSFDKVASALVASTTRVSENFRVEGRESTDVFLIPDWLDVRADDELRRGRRLDITGAVQPYRYIVNGIRTYESFAYQGTKAVFCAITQ